jgi:hypothetical protein
MLEIITVLPVKLMLLLKIVIVGAGSAQSPPPWGDHPGPAAAAAHIALRRTRSAGFGGAFANIA